MTSKIILFWLISCLLIASCGVVPAVSTEFSSTQAGDLIRRNLLTEDGLYQIDDPRAFQYGNLHVDGPSGGMLYRFSSNPDILKWLIEHFGLQKNMIDSADELPLDFLADRPRWWDPWKANPSAYYVFVEEFETGGERWLIVVYDSSTSVIYIVDHFEDMPGI